MFALKFFIPRETDETLTARVVVRELETLRSIENVPQTASGMRTTAWEALL